MLEWQLNTRTRNSTRKYVKLTFGFLRYRLLETVHRHLAAGLQVQVGLLLLLAGRQSLLLLQLLLANDVMRVAFVALLASQCSAKACHKRIV